MLAAEAVSATAEAFDLAKDIALAAAGMAVSETAIRTAKIVRTMRTVCLPRGYIRVPRKMVKSPFCERTAHMPVVGQFD